MLDTTTFQAWANKGHFTDWAKKPGRADQLIEVINAACSTLPPGAFMTTTKLLAHIFPGVNQKGANYFNNGVQYLRKSGMIGACYRRGKPNQFTFGRPSVEWINPVPVDGIEGLEGLL